MSLKNLFVFGFMLIFCLTLASCGLTITPDKFKAGELVQISTDFPSYSNFVYIYSMTDTENSIETIARACGTRCTGGISFNYDFPNYPIGKYYLKVLAGGEWVKAYFEIVEAKECFDSDIEAENLYESYGYVTTYNQYHYRTIEYDKCKNETILTEKICSGGKIAYEEYVCPNGCENGVCVSSNPCIPKTCSELGKTCGDWNDGCGALVTCGGDCSVAPKTSGEDLSTPVVAESCKELRTFVWAWGASNCCSGKVDGWGYCSDCQPEDAFVWWTATNCCSGKVDALGFCTPCLASETKVSILDQGNCCNSWKWVTKTSANFCGWCANGASTCWPWDWRSWWDAEHCGTSEVNDYQVCT